MHFLEELRAANTKRNLEWENSAKPFALDFWANELAGEAGEACNVLKKLDREHTYEVRGSRAPISALAEELADVVICCDLTAMCVGDTFRHELCWPSRSFVPKAQPYSLFGLKIMRAAGRVCGAALHYDDPAPGANAQIMAALHETMFATRETAELVGIKLEHWTTTKFNMTSEKLGLRTRL